MSDLSGLIPPDTKPSLRDPARAGGVPMLPRRRRRIGRWILLGVMVFVVALGAVLADAYLQALHAGRQLQTLVPLLQGAREDLLDPGAGTDHVDRAEAELRDLRSSVDGARFTFGLTAALPFLGRPVDAVRLGTDAADEAVQGLVLGREIVRDVTGGDEGGGLLAGGKVDLPLVQSFEPRLSEIVDHLSAARDDLAAIPSIPFFAQLDQLKADALADADEALRAGRRTVEGVALLPGLLGADGPRTYFLALQNNADLRGTGGAVLAWGLLKVADGEIHLEDGGAIGTLDESGGTKVRLPAPVRWYHRMTGRPLVINNGSNYSPNFPAVASVWAAQVEQLRGTAVDGVIAIDPEGAAALFAGQPPVTIPSAPVPIDAKTIAPFTEHGQYSLPDVVQSRIPGQLIAAAFSALTSPRDVLKMTTAVGTAMADKRIQLWMRDADAHRVVQDMGWDGAIHPGPGDYLLLTDNKRNPNKVDYFSQTTVDYTVRVGRDGTGHATAEVTLSTEVPPDESSYVVGPDRRYGLNIAMLGLHVPEQALVTAHETSGPVNYRTRPLGFVTHRESGVKVLTQTVASWAGHPASFTVSYDIPDLVTRTGAGKVYTLTLQHQPVVNPTRVTVHLELPEHSKITGALPGWEVDGAAATFGVDLTRDLVTSITYH